MDKVNPLKRSEIMGAVRSSNTNLEREFSDLLSLSGYKFTTQPKDLPGKPDFYIGEQNVAVFLDSCFWHGCKKHCRYPKSNSNYWIQKIQKNQNRDRKITRIYKKEGPKIIRVWEHQLRDHPDTVIRRIKRAAVPRSRKGLGQ